MTIQNFFRALRANFVNLFFFSTIIYLAFSPVLWQLGNRLDWLGMIPTSICFAWFIGQCIAQRIWLQIDVLDLRQYNRRTRRKAERKMHITKREKKMWRNQYPIIRNMFDGFRLKN